MKRKLFPSLRREMEWAIGTLSANGSPSTESLDMIHRAIHPGSPMLPKRFEVFVSNSAPYRLDKEEANRLGTLLLALEAWGAGKPFRLYQPGEFDDEELRTGGKQSEHIQIRCTPVFKARLRAYCERSGREVSTLIRAAVENYLQDNPLWQNSSGEPETAHATEIKKEEK